ncbi:MAG: penicillin acylase family protein [Candidatus Zixiibacteriota bacterium]|nr:MAG: penicillin acylase family protein [candidate division Zixibacteria bacterium]
MPGSKAKKILSFAAISLVGLAIGVAASFYFVLRASIPVTNGEIAVDGIVRPVEVTFDSMGICQIWAQTEADAYFALGYQHAADRMFQMDLSRRIAGGRLSEMLGSVTREIDIEQRRIGHYRLAQKALSALSDENRRRLQAYSDGVNAYKRKCRALPFEYRFLPIRFEDWTVLDCLTLLSFQTWFSNALMDRDEFYLELAKEVGESEAQTLMIPYPSWAPTIVPETGEVGLWPDDGNLGAKPLGHAKLSGTREPPQRPSVFRPFQRAIANHLFSNTSLPLLMTHSSNNWVISPQNSASGAAMLASDPHLELTRLPQFWYAAGVHIEQDSVNVMGISTPGLPFFIMRHNGQAARAFTAGGVDVTDYRIEKINPDDSNQYLTPGGWRDFEIIPDSVYISGLDSIVQVSFTFTQNGPVIETGYDDDRVISMHWAGFDVDLDRAVSSGFDLHHVRTFEDFRVLATGLGALDANMMYADADGNIGYQLTTPVRSEQSKTADRPPGYLPLDETPHAKNPSRGWLASCNNLPRRSPSVDGHFFSNRIISITNLLEDRKDLTSDDMRQFQMDQYDHYRLRFKDDIARILDTAGESGTADLIRSWDGSMGIDSKEAALVEVYFSELKRLTFEDELGSLYSQVPDRWIEAADQVSLAGWFDDVSTPSLKETFDDIAVNAMEEALGSTGGVAWGEIHTLTMRHPLAMIPIVGSLLNLQAGPHPWGGSSGTLCASFSRETGDSRYESVAGPSWRFVIDFANVDSATMVLPAGNSGNPMSDHFFDFNQMWVSGEQWVVPFSYEKVKAKAVSTLVLSPTEPADS